MAPAQILAAVALALAAPARGQELLVLESKYAQGNCTTGVLYERSYSVAGNCMPGYNALFNCSSGAGGAVTLQSCGDSAHTFSHEIPTDCQEDDGQHNQRTCVTSQAYGVLEVHLSANCDGDIGMSMAFPLDECLVKDGNGQKLTSSGFFIYEGVTDCTGTGRNELPQQMRSGACIPSTDGSGTGAMRFRTVGFTMAGEGLASGAAKAGPVLGCALLVLVAAAAAAE